MDKHAIKESVKSFLRAAYFMLLGLVGTFITSFLASADLQNKVIRVFDDTYIPVGVILVAVLSGVAKLIDRYVRESKGNDLNGIAPDFLQR